LIKTCNALPIQAGNRGCCEHLPRRQVRRLCLENYMRFRSAILSLIVFLFLSPAALAQKRTYRTVNPNAGAVNNSADLYDPQSGAFSPTTGNLNVEREQHSSILLNNGKVLIVGGYNNQYLNSAELYDPASGLFTTNKKTIYNSTTGKYETIDGSLVQARSSAASVSLLGGRVFIVGGYNGEKYLATGEIYDPSSGAFISTYYSMNEARADATATRINNGRVLITGGYNGSSFLASAELFDPPSQYYATVGSMSTSRDGHTATLLFDGKVLVTGGCTSSTSSGSVCDKYLNSAEIWDPTNGAFSTTGSMNVARAGHAASILPDGRVLITGGTDGGSLLASAEIYNPSTGAFTSVGNMGAARKGHTATQLSNGRILMAGGYSGSYLDTAELFDPTSNTFTTISSTLSNPRSQHAATILSDGRVLLTGGRNRNLLVFDYNYRITNDNVSPNIIFSSDSSVGFVPYTGSGVVVAFSTETGGIIQRIETGGNPVHMTLLSDGDTLAVVSALDNRIFFISMSSFTVQTRTYYPAWFGFGSALVLSPDGTKGYVSSSGTGEVIKIDIATRNDEQRLSGLQTPAQLTVTPDGNLLIVVDTSLTEVYFVNTSSMTVDHKMTPLNSYAAASFTIFNKAVLTSDGQVGVIGSQDSTDTSNNTLYVFRTSTGEILNNNAPLIIGYKPGYTALTPDNKYWLVLNQDSVALVPTDNYSSGTNVSTASGGRLGSANVVMTSDSKYAFYAASGADLVYQFDLQTYGEVGAYLSGDNPNVNVDQASSVALTPDEKTLAVLNFTSNELNLLTDATALRGPKFLSTGNQFTGLTLINLSDTPANVTLTALDDSGKIYSSGILENPATLEPIAPNAQVSFELAKIFNFYNFTVNQGHFYISSDQPGIVGFASTGQIRSDFLTAYVDSMEGMPLYRFPYQLHDWIIPEIPDLSGIYGELNFTNPNYNKSLYDLTHYNADGVILETISNNSISGGYRVVTTPSVLLTKSYLGYVLLAGGTDTKSINSSDLYVPSTESFQSTTGALAVPRSRHAAVQLLDGRVLISGGKNGYVALKSAEIYDPSAGYYTSAVGTMTKERFRHTATLLGNGKALIAGGQNSMSYNNTAELFDPITNTFTAISNLMTSVREAHTAVRMQNGNVLLAGGIDGSDVSSTAELYDPVTSGFTATGNMNFKRAFHTSVVLNDGRVLIAGGYNGAYLNSAEIYDPSTGIFTLTSPMNNARSNHTCTLLENGTVLITGGRNSSEVLKSAEIYDPLAGVFFPLTGTMSSARSHHTATLIKSGNVLIVGGTDGTNSLDSAEVYESDIQQFTALASTVPARWGHTATLLEGESRGYLRIKSSVGMMFTELYGPNDARVLIPGIDVEKNIGVTRIYSSHFTTVDPFKTILNVINANQDNEVQVTITLHAPDGSILGTPLTRTLMKNAQIKDDILTIFGNDPAIDNRTGWIEVTSDRDPVVGIVYITNDDNTFMTTHEFTSESMLDFVFPLAPEDNFYQTGILLLNPNGGSASVDVELWTPGGTLDRSVSVSLGAGERTIRYLSDYFPGLPPQLYGNIRIHSTLPLISYSLLNQREFNFATTVPPIPYPAELEP
jgi:hypothetical protein